MAGRTLADLCTHLVDCPHKTAPLADAPHGYAVGTTAIGVDGTIAFNRARPVNAITYEAWTARATPKPGDLILCREAPVGPVAVVPEDPKVCLGQRTVLLRPDPRFADYRWLAYRLRSPETQASMRSQAEGSTVVHLNVSDVRGLRVEVPALEEQRAIVSVLGTLDDKIESNRRLGNAIWNVITEEFRRACPIVGGGGATLSDLATVVMGQAPPGSSYIDAPAEGALPMIQGNGGFGVHFVEPTVWTTAPTKVVAPGTPLMTVRAPVGSVNQAASEICLGRGVAGLVSTRPVLVECLLRELQRVDGWVAHESGTIYPSVNRNQIAGLPIGSLPEAKAETFEEWATPMAGEVRVLERESHTLVAIRDALLPKLVSGQIRVPLSDDPEEQLGAAAEGLEIAEGAA